MKIKIGEKNYKTVRVGAYTRVPAKYGDDKDISRVNFNNLAVQIAKRLQADGLIEEEVEPIEKERGGGIAFVASLLVLVEEKEEPIR